MSLTAYISSLNGRASSSTTIIPSSNAVLLSTTVEDANPHRIIMTYDSLASSPIPKAGSYGVTEGRLVKGDFPTPNAYNAKAIGYGNEITTGTGDIGAGEDVLFYMNKATHTKLRQTGNLYSIQVYIDTLPGTLTGLYFELWDGTGPAGIASFKRIHRVNILSKVTAGQVNTIVFDTPLSVRAGYFTGFGFTSSSNIATNIFKSAPATYAGYLLDGSDYVTSDTTDTQTWGTNHSDFYIPLTGFMTEAPLVVTFGDSLIAGFSIFYGNLDPTSSLTPMGWKFSTDAFIQNKLQIATQNHGWSGQTSQQIKDRLIDPYDGIAVLRPKFTICEGGINNVNNDPSNTNIIKGHFIEMFDACIAVGSIPVVAKTWGADPRSNDQMTQMDVLSAWFDTMKATTYPSLIIVDPRAALGKFRPSGPVGNLWDMKPEVQSDALHLNPLGNEILADHFIDGILKSVPVIKSGNSLYLDVNHDYSSSDIVTVTKSGSTLVPAISSPQAVTNNIVAEPEKLYANGIEKFGSIYDYDGSYPYTNGPAGGKMSKKLPANTDGWIASKWQGLLGFRINGDYTDFTTNFNVNAQTDSFDILGAYNGQYAIYYNQGSLVGFGTSPALNVDWWYRIRRTGGDFFLEQCATMSSDDSDWSLIGALNHSLFNSQAELFIFFASAAIEPYGFGLVSL